MFTVIKDKEIVTVDNRQTLAIYLANGWKVKHQSEEKSIEPSKSVSLEDLTKKELQERLEQKGIEFNPRDSKTALIEKIGKVTPANDFDDGLLKG